MRKIGNDILSAVDTKTSPDPMTEALISEGLYDRGIFKAFFLAGGPGSGKSFVTERVTSGLNLKLINSDTAFERGLSQAMLSFNIDSMTPEEYDHAMLIRKRAKDLTNMRQSLAIEGRLGLIMDGTGKEYDKITRQADGLKELGYDNYMIFVNTSLNVALERNLKRARTVPEEIVKASWKQVQDNMGKFQNYFGSNNFIVVDNNAATEDVLLSVWKKISKLVDEPVKNWIAKQWISSEQEKRRR